MHYIDILIIFIVIYGVVMSDEDKNNNTSDTKKEAKKYKYTDSGLDISSKKVVYEGNKPGKVVSPRLQGKNRGNITF
ncbi:MAG: hypothetical protein PG981_000648 [Wolbachia endosymbiont of Ctenocephalides orientis wCori]|nr:MAG: hypothetical protein PG981_000648 [Wolbachia endosymbiont of Ctenocephalides orientis wCori]